MCLSSHLEGFIISAAMNPQVTNDSRTTVSDGQVHLLYKRKNQQHAALLEDDCPKYFLKTSDDGVNKVKILDAAQQVVAKVNRRVIRSDALTLTKRNGGKPMKAADVLKKVPSTLEGQTSTALCTEEGTYYWRQKPGHHWELYEDPPSSTPVAWTEKISGPSPTWALVLENRVMDLVDYVLASLFYLKGQAVSGKDGWESVDAHTANLLMDIVPAVSILGPRGAEPN